MTVSTLSTTNGSFVFDAFTDLMSENLMLRGLGNNKNETIKKEDDDIDVKIKTKYKIDEDPPPPYPFDTISVLMKKLKKLILLNQN